MKLIRLCARGALLILLCVLLGGCDRAPFGEYTLDGGLVCRVWGSSSGIRRLETTAADGTLERFSLKSPDIEPDPQGGVALVDLDFDGHTDLSIKHRQYPDGEARYLCFLWRDGRLVRHEGLSQLRGLTVHPETRTLTAWAYRTVEEEEESRAHLTYVWHEGEPVLTEKTELIHYLEDEIYCRVVWTAAPGEELTMAEEDWIFVEEYDPDQIWGDKE